MAKARPTPAAGDPWGLGPVDVDPLRIAEGKIEYTQHQAVELRDMVEAFLTRKGGYTKLEAKTMLQQVVRHLWYIIDL